MADKKNIQAGKYLLNSIITGLCILIASCGLEKEVPESEVVKPAATEKIGENISDKPLLFEDIRGSWSLQYQHNYGYNFQFYPNYKSIIILYLSNLTLVFKGVYTVEEKSVIRINIYEMKHEKNPARVNLSSGFVKAKSSYFLFLGSIKDEGKSLAIRPIKTIIDGNNSGGYFEPYIKLKKK